MDPNDKKPAPGPLRVVQKFVNTRNNLRESDLLENVEGTVRWLAEQGLHSGGSVEVSEADRRRLISLRESLRRALVIHTVGIDEERETAAVFEELDDLADDALLRVSFDSSGKPYLCPAKRGVEEAMALMLAVVIWSAAEGTWERLKACRNEGCRWVFYDSSKNHSGIWCDMDTCGARHKMRAYRKRKSG